MEALTMVLIVSGTFAVGVYAASLAINAALWLVHHMSRASAAEQPPAMGRVLS